MHQSLLRQFTFQKLHHEFAFSPDQSHANRQRQSPPPSPPSPASATHSTFPESLVKMQANGRAAADPYRDWINQSRHPLFWESWQVKPTAEKLAAIRAALDDGADPNMIDRESSPPDHSGRPLHCAIAAGRTLGRHQGVVPWAATRENLPVIELLLERGADPRLEGMAPRPGPQWLLSPIEEAGVNMAYPTNPDEDFEEVKAFYTQAVVLMKAAAERLDKAETQQLTSESKHQCQVS